jgi:ethanolaminephosphotransferase
MALEGPLPFWYGIFAGVFYFANTVFDNMDGKQARRTGAGSPMGMVFDHGTDALVACMSGMILTRVMQSGGGIDG